MSLHIGQLVRRQTDPADQIGVEHADATLPDGPISKFGLKWQAKLADDDHIERGIESAGHLCSHRDPAPRKCQYYGSVVMERSQTFGQ